MNHTKNDETLLKKYWSIYKKLLFVDNYDKELIKIKDQILKTNKNRGKLIFFGNGASASLSSHAATDFSKQAKIESIALNDHNLLTAFSNDYGYSNWVKKSIEIYAKHNDLIFFISVSGESENLKNGLNYAKEIGLRTISFTGCNKSNYLKVNSDLGIWIDCSAYNIVESIHTICITSLIDLIIGKAIYSVN
tara:strand:+ start:494 stop:1069 length:576 start_codon:yes stop_codon:yes gene_type:complete